MTDEGVNDVTDAVRGTTIIIPTLSFIGGGDNDPVTATTPGRDGYLLMELGVALLLVLIGSFKAIACTVSGLLSNGPCITFSFVSPCIPAENVLPYGRFGAQ